MSPVSAANAWLLVGLTASSGGTVKVMTLSDGMPVSIGTIDLATNGGNRDYLLPVSQQSVDGVALTAETVGQDLCVSSIDVGTFSPT